MVAKRVKVDCIRTALRQQGHRLESSISYTVPYRYRYRYYKMEEISRTSPSWFYYEYFI